VISPKNPKKKSARPSLVRELLKSKSAMAGVAILVILAGLTIYATTEIPGNIYLKWQNGQAWILNPIDVPPTWVNYLGSNAVPTVDVNINNWHYQNLTSGESSLYMYTSSENFSWSSKLYPQSLAFEPIFNGTVSTISVTFAKPDNGGQLVISLPSAGSGQVFEAQSSSFGSAASQYIQTQTHQFLTSLTKKEVVSAFFGPAGTGLLNSSAVQGAYQITVQIIGTSKLSISSSPFVVVGNSYGSMGTDSQGRPIDLGILAGLPNALEIGFLVAIVSVVGGVIFGGISGYLGARKDGIMQWVTLVILAMPALPFLVVMSYVVKLNTIVEVLLIAGLSWPFYAIIARTVALSVKSQTFVDADRAMGIPAYRVFFSHFMPRLIPVTVAYTVLGIPAGILLAETLSFLGVVPANLITWGGILQEAFSNQAAVYGFWWWVAFPGLMIVVTATPFVLVGFALERIIAPRVAAK
jgi:peptide/nickel transport system permease protein